MKLCFVASNLDESNGNGRFTYSLIRALRREGHETLILIERGQEERMGAQAVLFSHGKFAKFVLNPIIIAWLARKNHAQMIHAFDAWPWGVWAYLANVLSGVPFGMTMYATYGVYPLTRKFQGPLLRAAYRASTLNAAISHETARRIRERVPEVAIAVINQGIECESYQGPVLHERVTAHPYILTVAYMKRRKGYDVAIRVFAKLVARFPDLRYVIRAPGEHTEYSDRIRRLADELDISKHIIWLPKLDESALADVFRNSLVFFLPSISSDPVYFEGFGSVYLEAQACGVPVVTSSGGGQEDALIDGTTGFLIPEGDVEAGAERLSMILGDPERRKEMSSAARDFARSLDWSIIAKEYSKRYTARISR